MLDAQITTVIWDLDGTIADSIADISTSLNHVLESYQLPSIEQDDARVMVGGGAGKLLERAFSSVGGQSHYDADAAYKRFSDHYGDHCCVKTSLYSGIVDALNELSDRGFQHGVCTNKPEAIARSILQQLSVGHYFKSVVGGDSTPHRKPHAAPLQFCLAELGVQSRQCIMVGDSAADIGVARALDMPVAVFPWGYTAAPAASLGADYLVKDAASLLALFGNKG